MFSIPGLGSSELSVLNKGNSSSRQTGHNELHTMLVSIALILIVLWGFGLATGFTLGGIIHVGLVAAICILVWKWVDRASQL